MFTIQSALIRGALTAILWLQPLAAEHFVTAALDDAFEWASTRIRKSRAA